MQRTLSGENKTSDLDEEIINDTLTASAIQKLRNEPEIYVIHDPSDIRKPYSKKSENLGEVRDLNNNIINGYSSYNMVAITPHSKEIHLLSHDVYSNKDARFLKAEIVRKIQQNKLPEDQKSSMELYDSENWYNKKTLTKDGLTKVSGQIKKENPSQKITHIMDREFDDDDYISTIATLNDEFVIRAKKSRTVESKEGSGNKKIKLINAKFTNKYTHKIQKVRFKNTCYQDATLEIEWQDQIEYRAVKITAKDRKGREIFNTPMLLMTNKEVVNGEQAFLIYQIYLKRSRIECVFKFLKEGLGWEEVQVQDFQSIKRLLSFCFFIAAYLYEIGDQKAHDDYVILLSKLGGGKGLTTKHYILKGIKALLSKYRVDRIFQEYKPSEDDIEYMLDMAGASF
jgi:hypothetical protein